MGRYYSGDIEGKFWVAVQPSDDADFFGVEGRRPDRLEYYFDTDNLKDINTGIRQCKDMLGDYKQKIDQFFKENMGYNDEMLKKAGIKPSLIQWYARLELGKKILKCVKDNGYCSFEAEL